MKNFIAIVKSTDGVLEKFQDFDTKSEADAHISKFGGWVAPNPSGNSKKYWVIDEVSKTIGYNQTKQDEDIVISDDAKTSANAKKASGKQKLKDLGLDDDEIKQLTGT